MAGIKFSGIHSMKLLLALDSRPSNRAAIGILDPHTANWERFEIVDVAEQIKRKGFRGATVIDDRLYVLSSAVLYIYRLNTTDPAAPTNGRYGLRSDAAAAMMAS